MSVSDPLRELAGALRAMQGGNRTLIAPSGAIALSDRLLDLADAIDADHESRMEQCRRETRRAMARYIRAVVSDYERGIKRVRK